MKAPHLIAHACGGDRGAGSQSLLAVRPAYKMRRDLALTTCGIRLHRCNHWVKHAGHGYDIKTVAVSMTHGTRSQCDGRWHSSQLKL